MRSFKLALAACALLALPATAQAGPPGTWTKVTGIELAARNTDELGLTRTADGVLHFAYTIQPAGGPDTLLHKALAADAKSVSGPDTIAQLSSLTNRPILGRERTGGIRVFFSGLTGAPGVDGFMRTTVAGPDGKTWSPPAPASNTSPAGVSKVYTSSGIGAAPAADGTPITIWGDSGPGDAGIHIGLDPADADIQLFPGENRCCIINPSLATDSTGRTFAAWVNLIGGNRFAQVRQLGGATVQVPNSGAAELQTRFGMTARGNAVYLAYIAGTNQFSGVPALWKVGDATPRTVAGQRNARSVGLSRAPGGRLWMFWAREGRVVATRMNKAATKFGALVSIRPPANVGTIYRIAGEGSRGPLDVFGLFQRGGSDLGYWHQRILPGLSLGATPAVVADGGKVTFKVTDAGDAVGGAKVALKLGSQTVSGTTGANGRVKLTVPSGTRAGRYTATATKGGYVKGTKRIRVR